VIDDAHRPATSILATVDGTFASARRGTDWPDALFAASSRTDSASHESQNSVGTPLPPASFRRQDYGEVVTENRDLRLALLVLSRDGTRSSS
jgi:hypothetical protein